MKPLLRVIYISEIDKERFDSEMLQDILKSSKKNNTKNDITGVLICDYSHFLQVLEGENDKVSETLVKIIKDDRHLNFKLVSAKDADDRYFSNWAMEFKELESLVEGETDKISQMSSDEIIKLLESIRS